MVFFDIGGGGADDGLDGASQTGLTVNPSWWLYLAVTIPLTTVVILVWVALLWHKGFLGLRSSPPQRVVGKGNTPFDSSLEGRRGGKEEKVV